MISKDIIQRVLTNVRNGNYGEAGFVIYQSSSLTHDEAATIADGFRQLMSDVSCYREALARLRAEKERLMGKVIDGQTALRTFMPLSDPPARSDSEAEYYDFRK